MPAIAHITTRTARAGASPGRATKKQRDFREAVLTAAGGRCQWVEDGRRCTQTKHLHAHHLAVLRDTGSFNPADGVALCPRHHIEADRRLHGLHPARSQFGFPCHDAA